MTKYILSLAPFELGFVRWGPPKICMWRGRPVYATLFGSRSAVVVLVGACTRTSAMDGVAIYGLQKVSAIINRFQVAQ